MAFFLNTIVAAIIIALVTQLSQRFALVSAALLALPLTSVIALIFLYIKTEDVAKISEVSYGIFWLVIPSLGFFLILPALLKHGMNFWLAMLISVSALAVVYPLYNLMLTKTGFLK